MDQEQPIFVEKQRFTQWYIWSILFLVMAVCLYAFISQIIFHHPVGSNPASDVGLIIVCFIPLSILLLFWTMTLTTTVYADSIHIRFVPFFSKTIFKTDIRKSKVIRYGFVGYGIHFSSAYGTVYNIKGNIGLQIFPSNGEKFVIGTQRGDELSKILQATNVDQLDLNPTEGV